MMWGTGLLRALKNVVAGKDNPVNPVYDRGYNEALVGVREIKNGFIVRYSAAEGMLLEEWYSPDAVEVGKRISTLLIERELRR